MTIDVQSLVPLLQVYDMPRALQFYRDVLGFRVVGHSPSLGSEDRFHWVMLQLGGATLMLNTTYEHEEERPPVPDVAREVAHGDTELYFGCPDVVAAHRELLDRGVEVTEPIVTGYGMKQLYFRDPDGYGLCLQWPVAE